MDCCRALRKGAETSKSREIAGTDPENLRIFEIFAVFQIVQCLSALPSK